MTTHASGPAPAPAELPAGFLPGAIDCDIHPEPPRRADLLPYLDPYWREAVVSRDVDRLDLTSYPLGAPLTARPDWRAGAAGRTGLDRVRTDVLDRFRLGAGILNCLYGAPAMYNEHFGGALCRATNDWIRDHWLEPEPRLRASILVSPVNPDTAAEEVERVAADPRFVQVLFLAQGELPLGRKYYWPIYAAAERHGLPIGIHAGSAFRHAPTQSGFPSYFAEDYAGQTQGFAAQLLSLIAEGVFARFPGLKVVLIESGVTWLPSLMWRMSKDWLGVRTEVPWVKTRPANIIREHVRLTVQPFDGPPDSGDVEKILRHLGSEDMLMFSTDYPHWQFDGDAAVPDGFPAAQLRKLLVENARATYARLPGQEVER